jgi:hypothetical protein
MRQERAPAHVTQAMLEVVENQIKAGDPPETKITLKRLLDSGIPRKEAIRQIACAIGNEMFNIMKHGEEFNEKRYVENLKNLPAMPWD